ncbi:hypothetical protein [Paenibacillus xanthanilyticus]|uniref:Uncharacterized protein n=1 Tax=Paenibacillus xanthanilyticus TaxID=1783531 RepID=A0ABV8JZL2_9BACL
MRGQQLTRSQAAIIDDLQMKQLVCRIQLYYADHERPTVKRSRDLVLSRLCRTLDYTLTDNVDDLRRGIAEVTKAVPMHTKLSEFKREIEHALAGYPGLASFDWLLCETYGRQFWFLEQGGMGTIINRYQLIDAS